MVPNRANREPVQLAPHQRGQQSGADLQLAQTHVSAGLARASASFLQFGEWPKRTQPAPDLGNYIAAMRPARRLASGVTGSTAGGACTFLVERGRVQSHSSAPIW
jgi:hypothetical protein